jgi:phenylacetate-coenzyme A ligase PaaK-like adenylate-forming protein
MNEEMMMEMLKTMLPINGEFTFGELKTTYRIFLTKIKGKDHLVIAIPLEKEQEPKNEQKT